MGAIVGLLSVFGQGIMGMFGWKQAQAETVNKAIELIGTIDSNDAQATAAFANALNAILTQGSWLERNWRSFLMTGLTIMLFASFFGYVPPHLNDAMSENMAKYYHLIEIGLGGYIVRTGIVDVMRSMNISSVLKALIEKKLT